MQVTCGHSPEPQALESGALPLAGCRGFKLGMNSLLESVPENPPDHRESAPSRSQSPKTTSRAPRCRAVWPRLTMQSQAPGQAAGFARRLRPDHSESLPYPHFFLPSEYVLDHGRREGARAQACQAYAGQQRYRSDSEVPGIPPRWERSTATRFLPQVSPPGGNNEAPGIPPRWERSTRFLPQVGTTNCRAPWQRASSRN